MIPSVHLLSYSKSLIRQELTQPAETQLIEGQYALRTPHYALSNAAHRLSEQALTCRLWPSVSGQAVGPAIPLRKPFPCTHCERSYKNKSSLNRHMQYECGRNVKFICPICQTRVLTKRSLPKHMRVIHGIWTSYREIERDNTEKERDFLSLRNIRSLSIDRLSLVAFYLSTQTS